MKGLIYILLLCCLDLNAQNFEKIDFNNGLSQNSVLSIEQDDSGFVWLGTADGVNRFDGINTKVFRYNKQEENGICGNEVMDIVNDGRGNLWIATSSCLNKFNLSNYQFSAYSHAQDKSKGLSGSYISELELLREHICIVSEKGLDMINLDTEEITRIENPYGGNVIGISAIDDSKILVSNTIGLFILSVDDKKLTKLESQYDIKYNHDNILRSIVDKSSLFVAYQDKIIKFDLETGHSKQLYGVDYIETEDIEKFQNKLWFCTSKGLMTYDFESEEFNSGQTGNLPKGVAVNSFIRKEDEIWFSVGTGVFKYSESKKIFETIKVNANHKGIGGFNKVWHLCNEEDAIIVSTEQGISFISPDGDVLPIKEMLDLDMDIQFVSNVTRDEDNMWICTFDSGIYHIDLKTMDVQNYSKTQHGNYHLKSNTVRHSLVLEDEVLFSTDGGLYSFDKKSRIVNEINYHDNKNELAKKTTFCLLDDDNRLWVGTQNGLYIKKENEDKFINLCTSTEPSLSNNRIRNITQYSSSIFLVGTSSGLNVFDIEDNTIDYIDVNTGLENDVIYSLQIDDDSDIWVSTNKGISLVRKDKKIWNYNIHDGLQGSEFNTNASVKSKNGDFYFGGLYGITKFNPLKVKNIKENLKPIITKLEILPHEDEQGFEISYPLQDKYEFKNYQCNFIINFTSINFENPENNIFYYKLEGYSHEWIKVTGDNKVQFMNLPKGTYNFKVKASLRNEDLSHHITSLKLEIHPPFYTTFFFGFLMFLLLSSIGLIIYRMRIKAVKKRNSRLENIVSEQTNELKHANNLQEIFLNEIPEPLIIFNSKNEITITNDLYKKVIQKKDQMVESLGLGLQKISSENLTNLEYELSIDDKHYQFKFNRIVFNEKDYGVAVLLRDTTKLKDAEYSLRKNEILFRSYFEKSPIGIIYVTDPLKPITNCNLKFCEMLDEDKEVILTKTMTDLTHPSDLEKDTINFLNAINNKKTYLFEPNKRLICSEGGTVMTETHVTFIYDDNDQFQYMFVLIHDVTKQRENQKKLIEARTQLIQSEKLASLGQITAGVAHEINNPVNFIYNGVNNLKPLINILKSKHNSDDLVNVYTDIQQMIDAVEDGAKRTAEIVKSLRQFTRADTNHLVSYDIISGIESTLKLLSNKLTDDVKIKREYKLKEFFVNCYPGQLNQVFLNLILNAIEAIDKVGVIKIDIDVNDTVIKIIIKDSGSGIKNEISKLIFEPFFSTKGPINGTGLGLSISNTIIKRHKGSIVFDENEPKGTICIISIPTTLSKEL